MTSVVSDTYFLSLPNESLLQILRYLNYKDLTRLDSYSSRDNSGRGPVQKKAHNFSKKPYFSGKYGSFKNVMV